MLVHVVYWVLSQNCEKTSISFIMSLCLSVRPYVRPYGTTRLPLDRFSRNSIIE